jgi:hypothetical protein
LHDDSDDDDEDNEMLGKMQDVDEKDTGASLSPDEATFQGELADGVGRMRVSLLSLLSRNDWLTWTRCVVEESSFCRSGCDCHDPGHVHNDPGHEYWHWHDWRHGVEHTTWWY